MTNIAIIVGESRDALQAKAESAGLTILPKTVKSFATLTTYLCPGYEDAGTIDTGEAGWVALATSP